MRKEHNHDKQPEYKPGCDVTLTQIFLHVIHKLKTMPSQGMDSGFESVGGGGDLRPLQRLKLQKAPLCLTIKSQLLHTRNANFERTGFTEGGSPGLRTQMT